MTRAYIIDRIRIRALGALWKRDDATWERCCDLLDRDAKKVQRSYTADRREVANA